MSRTVDLFLDSDQPLELVALQFSELTSAQLRPLPDGARFVLQEEGVTAYLSEHDFLDDDDLPLSEFPYVLSARVRGVGDIDHSPEACYLRRLNARWREQTGLPSLLVIDLERPDATDLATDAPGPTATPGPVPGSVGLPPTAPPGMPQPPAPPAPHGAAE